MTTEPHPYDGEVGAQLRAVRLRAVVKQAELAAVLGVQRAAVTRWEQGTRGLSVAMLLTIADRFGVPAQELLPARYHAAPPAPPAPSTPEDGAIASIVRVLRERPELIVGALDYLAAASPADETVDA